MRSALILSLNILFLFLVSCAENEPNKTEIEYGKPILLLDSPEEEYSKLNDYLFVLADREEGLDFESVISQNLQPKFRPYNLVKDSTDEPYTILWGRIKIRNRLGFDISKWILRTGNGSFFDVYFYDSNNNLITSQKTGQFYPSEEKEIKTFNKKERVYLNLPDGETVTVFIKNKRISGHLPEFNLNLSQKDFNQQEGYGERMFDHGGFLGFMFTMLLFNLVFYFGTRDITFFWQSVFLFFVSCFILEQSGFLCNAPWFRNHPKSWLTIVYGSIFLTNVGYVQFVRHYMDLRNLFPKWDRFFKVFILLNLITGVGFVIYYLISLNEKGIDDMLAVIVPIQYLPLFILMAALYFTKDKKAYFLIGATLLIIVGVLVIVIKFAMGGRIDFDFFIRILTGNVILFFLGLAYRMSVLQREEREAYKLKEINEMKARFYTNITHEFRTPLTVISGVANDLDEEITAEKQNIRLIKDNSNRLLKLVNRLMDLAKLESGKMQLNLVKGDITGYLRYLSNSFESHAKSKKINLRFLTELTELETAFDEEKLQQIVSNLLSNAVKFTPEGGQINFIVKKESDSLKIEIEDNGKGIAAEELPEVFERFFQANSVKSKEQGTGVGLALVKELVKLHGGTIDVRSELGSGTTFTVFLPIISSDGVEFRESFSETRPGLESDIESNSTDLVQNTENAFEKPQLLIIEDDFEIVKFLKPRLESEYVLSFAYDGKEGIESALKQIPDIIVSDVMMPEKDGLEVLDTLKTDERTSHIPIILLTAKAGIEDRLEGLERGADAYIPKPFDKRELTAVLKNLIKGQKRLLKRYSRRLPEKISVEVNFAKEDAFLIKIREVVEAEIDRDLSVTQLCRKLNISRTQLHRKITALTGESITHFLNLIRLNKSKMFLETAPEMNISEIAYAVGYKDPNYFSKLFKEYFGMSPTEYRNRL